MSVYDLHFNKDDVTLRNILIGFLATLHDSIYWYNQVGSDVSQVKLIKVPFYYSTTGTERYLQDNFLNNIDFDPQMLEAEAFYNNIPRGIVQMEGISVEGTAIVNKYVRMRHQKQELDGTLNTYNSEAFFVPIVLNMQCEVYLDSNLDMLKCTEAIIKTFFKNKVFQVDVGYTRLPCLAIFPDDISNERTIEFSFTDKKEFKASFTVQVKSHIPIYKEGTTLFEGNRMDDINGNIYVPPVVYGSTAIISNNGAPAPSGSVGVTYGAPFDPQAWPEINPTPLPPGPTSN